MKSSILLCVCLKAQIIQSLNWCDMSYLIVNSHEWQNLQEKNSPKKLKWSSEVKCGQLDVQTCEHIQTVYRTTSWHDVKEKIRVKTHETSHYPTRIRFVPWSDNAYDGHVLDQLWSWETKEFYSNLMNDMNDFLSLINRRIDWSWRSLQMGRVKYILWEMPQLFEESWNMKWEKGKLEWNVIWPKQKGDVKNNPDHIFSPA